MSFPCFISCRWIDIHASQWLHMCRRCILYQSQEFLMKFNVFVGAAALALTGTTSVAYAQNVPTVLIDGSSTVFPISEAVAEEFQKDQKGKTRVTVGVSGTGGGFKKFCRGELDIKIGRAHV